MTKDALESLRKRHSKYVSNCYCRDWLLAVACVDEIAAALEQAWAERDDAILCRNGLRDDLCGLNDELLEERNVLQGRLAAVEAREFPNTITTLEQTTETLAANNVKYFNTIVALEEERDTLKQALAIAQKNLDDTFGNMLEAQEERDALKTELQAWRDGGLTEEILRREGGYIKVGRGCLIISACLLDALDAKDERKRMLKLLRDTDLANDCLRTRLANKYVEIAAIKQDVIAYRGALGYPVPGDNLGLLSDGTTPKNGLVEVLQAEIAALNAKVAELDAVEVGSTLCPLEDVEDFLMRASNRLSDGRVGGDRLAPLGLAIDDALRLVQACLRE